MRFDICPKCGGDHIFATPSGWTCYTCMVGETRVVRDLCRILFAAFVWLAFALIVGAQEPTVDERIAELEKWTQEVRKPKRLSYSNGYRRAIAESKRLVVCVNCDEPSPLPGSIVCHAADFKGDAGPMVVLCDPDGSGSFNVIGRYPVKHGASYEWRLPAREVKPTAAIPFAGWPLPSARHDGDGEVTGPWPKSLEFPAGMKRYKRAAFTQEIAVTNGYDRISRVSRLDVPERWQHSGGLSGVNGWRSDLYRSDAVPRVFVANISVLNSLGYMQENRGWKAVWPDGARFMDVLSTPAGVFEVRERRKEGGRWKSAVIYRDAAARPKGYDGLTVACVSCHNHEDGPGTGGYATGLVPGSDTVFSFPFAALEQ